MTEKKKRVRLLPWRMMLPSIITVLAICAGLTSIRMGIDGRYEIAVGFICLAAFFDAIDGRVARLLRSTSRFGAELDSLADAVNFGVAPGFLIYFWKTQALGSFGWVATLIFAIAAVLRLARFNVAMDDEEKPEWQKEFFVGVPAPAGALLVMLPLYAENLFNHSFHVPEIFMIIFSLCVAYLMISRLPIWSGKTVKFLLNSSNFLPVVIAVLGFLGLIISYPFFMLTFVMTGYLLLLPFSQYLWRKAEKENAS